MVLKQFNFANVQKAYKFTKAFCIFKKKLNE